MDGDFNTQIMLASISHGSLITLKVHRRLGGMQRIDEALALLEFLVSHSGPLLGCLDGDRWHVWTAEHCCSVQHCHCLQCIQHASWLPGGYASSEFTSFSTLHLPFPHGAPVMRNRNLPYLLCLINFFGRRLMFYFASEVHTYQC